MPEADAEAAPPGGPASPPAPPGRGGNFGQYFSPERYRHIPKILLRSIIAVLVGSLVLRVAAQTMGQMLQFYLAEIDRNHYPISHTQRGLITASFFITELLGSLLLGAMSDRYGRKIFILLGPAFGAVAVQITSMTVSVWLLVITRLLEGLSTASSIPATLGYISEATTGRPSMRARVVGLFEITLVGGIAVGAIVGGYLWKFLGSPQTLFGIRLISPAFSVNGLIYVVSLLIFLWGLKEIRHGAKEGGSREHSHGSLGQYISILRSPSVWRFVPAWLAVNSIIGMWINHSIGLMTGKDHMPGQLLTGNIAPEKFGNGFAVLAVVFALGVLVWSFYLGRYRRTSAMLMATGGLFATLASVYSLNHLDSFSSPLYYPLLAALLVSLFVLSGFTPAALTYLADVTESHAQNRGSIMGLYSVFLGVGQVVGTATGGRFADRGGIDGLLLLSAIFGVITGWSLLALRRRELPTGGLKLPA